jgi:hypothetical protein
MSNEGIEKIRKETLVKHIALFELGQIQCKVFANLNSIAALFIFEHG